MGNERNSRRRIPVRERTVIYCRISLDAAGEGLGVDRQERECRELCDRFGWDVAEVYVDNDISATSGAVRPEFERLLKSLPTRVVCWHTDRLVRLSSDLERVIKLDIPVVGVTAGELDLSTPAGRAVAKTITAWAQYEGEQKALRQRAAHRQRAEAGRPFWGHRRPFGYNVDATLHEVEAPALRECYAMLKGGSTYADCASHLNDLGLTTTVGGHRWSGTAISRVIRDPRNAGLSHYGLDDDGEKVIVGRGEWEPMVDEEDWTLIVNRSKVIARGREKAGQGEHVRSLLGGIARCECGRRMKRTRQHSKRSSGLTVYTYIYQCADHCTSINAEWLDEYVSKEMLRHALNPARALASGEVVPDSDARAAALEVVELEKRLAELAEAYAEGEISREQLAKATARIEGKIALLSEIARSFYAASPLERAFSPAQLVAAWRNESLTLSQRREAIERFIAKIIVRKRLNRNERANTDMVTIEPVRL